MFLVFESTSERRTAERSIRLGSGVLLLMIRVRIGLFTDR